MMTEKFKNFNEHNICSSHNYDKTDTKMYGHYSIRLSSMAIITPVSLS